jgi:asparagine synthase (glutamine-hydrolysing)
MVSDVPLGAFLSGGLDSSAIVSFAIEKDPNIRCFTIETTGDQDKGIIDDLPYAKRVAKHLNVSLDVVTIDSHRMANDLESMVIQLDEPLADPAALNVSYISKLAREQGIKVLLSGAGGDDLFTGYRRHYALQLERYWAWMPRSARIGLQNFIGNINVNSPIQRRVTKMFSGAGSDSTDRLINYFRWSSDAVLQSLYSPEFRQELAESNANQVMQDFLEPIIDDTSSLDQMLTLEQRFFLADHNLIYTDKMSMAEGVEVRTPFLDLDLVEFSSKIPNRLKQKGSIGKWIFKRAMEPYLPKEIIYRPKTGFGAPLRTWIKNDLREMLKDLLSIDSVNKRGLFSAKAVQQLIVDNENGKIDASYTLLSLLCIEIWCRAYIN